MDMLSFIDKYAGGILAGAFFLLMARIFYWLLVIVPRRTKELYARLEMNGYCQPGADDASVNRLLTQFAPIFPKDPVLDDEIPAWKVKRAALRDRWGRQRVIVNVMRGQRSSPGVKSNYSTCTATILVEKTPVPVPSDLHLVPVRNKGSIRWNERYGLIRLSSGSVSSQLSCYEIYSAPGAVVDCPEKLVRVLIEACPLLEETSRFCFQHGVSLRFQPEGWGITTSNEIYKSDDFDVLVEMADRIGESYK